MATQQKNITILIIKQQEQYILILSCKDNKAASIQTSKQPNIKYIVEGTLPSDGVADLWSLLHNNGTSNYWVEVIICDPVVLYTISCVF